MSGGFRRKQAVYVLTFESTILNGLEVRMRSVSLQQLFDIEELQRTARKAGADRDASRKLIERVAAEILSWNLENDDGTPVEPSYEALANLDLREVVLIINAWKNALAAVPKALSNGSNGGGTSPELSIPMDVSSPNHEN